jgi:hypothetical protein
MQAQTEKVTQLLARLEAALALHRPEYLDELAPGLTDAEVELRRILKRLSSRTLP